MRVPGLDPRIDPAPINKRSLFFRWIAGSSPAIDNVGTSPAQIRRISGEMTRRSIDCDHRDFVYSFAERELVLRR